MSSVRKRKQGEFTEDYLLGKAKRDYDEGVASFRINPKKSALIVIDMIDEFTKPNYCPAWVPEATRQLPKIKRLIEAAKRNGVPVIYTCYAIHGSFADANPYFRNAWTPIDRMEDYEGPPLFTKESVDEAIKPNYEEDYVIAKPSYGAFTNTALDYILKNLGRDTLIVCGTMTNYCCGTTTRDAHARGYKVVFGSDVNSTDDPEIQAAELKTLRRGFALVASEAEIEDAINGRGKFAVV